MNVEITRELFRSIVDNDEKPFKLESVEPCHRIYYSVHGVVLIQIESYVACVTQFFIQDINA